MWARPCGPTPKTAILPTCSSVCRVKRTADVGVRNRVSAPLMVKRTWLATVSQSVVVKLNGPSTGRCDLTAANPPAGHTAPIGLSLTAPLSNCWPFRIPAFAAARSQTATSSTSITSVMLASPVRAASSSIATAGDFLGRWSDHAARSMGGCTQRPIPKALPRMTRCYRRHSCAKKAT